MKASLKRWANGPNTLVLFVGGLLMLLFLFLRGKSSSPQTAIKKRLKAKGYSDQFAKWWVAISNHETGTWSSLLFQNANNLFGMRQPKKRKTTSLGPVDWKGKPMPIITTGKSYASFVMDKAYASFLDYDSSVDDLILYLDEWNYPKDFSSVDELISFMKKKGYFEDPEALYLLSVKARLL